MTPAHRTRRRPAGAGIELHYDFGHDETAVVS